MLKGLLIGALACALPLVGCTTDEDEVVEVTDDGPLYAAHHRLAVPLAKLPAEIVDAARLHMHVMGKGVRTGVDAWQGATLAPFAIPLHRPDIEGPAYYELKVVRGSESLGFIVVATGGHDTPVPEFMTEGQTKAEALVARAAGNARKLYRLDGAVLVAEDANGEIADATAPQIPIVPASDAKREGPVDVGPWTGWKTLKRDFTGGFKREIESLRKQNVEHWDTLRSMRAAIGADQQLDPDVAARTWSDIYDLGAETTECEYNWAGPNSGPGYINDLTAKWDQLYSGFRHILSGTPTASCASGCTPTAAAIVLAWIDEQSRRTDSGVWSRPEMGRAFFRYTQAVPIDHLPFINYGYRAPYLPGAPFLQPANVYDYREAPMMAAYPDIPEAPLHDVVQDYRRYLTEIAMSMGTHCQGSSGNTHWNAIAGLQRFFDDHRIPVTVSTGSNPFGETAFRDNIINSLRTHAAPGFIHTGGWSGHTEVVNAHQQCRTRSKATGQITSVSPNYFFTNKGWGRGNRDGWIAVGSLYSSTTFSPKSPFVKLVPAHSGRCAEVPGGVPGQGLPILQNGCSGYPNQRWNFIPQTDGSYLIRNAQTQMCLDTRNANYNGPVDQWPCYGEANQRWRAEIRTDGKFLLRSSFSNLCLEVQSASTATGASIVQYYCDGVSSQVWDLAQ